MRESVAHRRALTAGISLGAASAVLAIAIWLVALRTHWGQLTDWIGFEGLTGLQRQGRFPDLEPLVEGARTTALVVLVIAAVALLVGRRQRLAGLQALVLAAGTAVTVAAMNELTMTLFRPAAVPTLPFGSSVDLTTALFAATGVAVIIAVRPANRAVVAVLIALLVGCLTAGQMVSYGERPTAHIIALLVAATWAGLAIAAGAVASRNHSLGVTKPAQPSASASSTAIGLITTSVLGAGSAVVAGMLISQWHSGTLPLWGRYGEQALTFLASGLAIAATASVVVAAVLAALHYAGNSPDPTPPDAIQHTEADAAPSQ